MSASVLIAGIGGQGTVLAAKALSAAALLTGQNVLSAETIGMAQRGGSVVSHVRLGENIYSPLVPKGGADLMIAFDASEAVRASDYLNDKSIVVVNNLVVQPVSASLKGIVFSAANMIEALKKRTKNVFVVDSSEPLKKIGSPKALNMLLLGAALLKGRSISVLPKLDDTLLALKGLVKPDFIEMNEKALRYFAAEKEN